MTVYLLILTLKIGLMPLGVPADAKVDTLLDGDRAIRRLVQVTGPRQAAVLVLDANRFIPVPSERWKGELYRVDIDVTVEGDRTVRPVRVPQIRAASDTLAMNVENVR